MVQAVSRRPVTADAVLCQVSSREVCCGTKWHWDRLFFEYLRCTLTVSFHHYCSHIVIYMLLLRELQTGEAWKPSKRQQ